MCCLHLEGKLGEGKCIDQCMRLPSSHSVVWVVCKRCHFFGFVSCIRREQLAPFVDSVVWMECSLLTENACGSLSSQPTGYVGFQLGCTNVSACNDSARACDTADGYAGAANPRTCNTGSGSFGFSGCTKTNGILPSEHLLPDGC